MVKNFLNKSTSVVLAKLRHQVLEKKMTGPLGIGMLIVIALLIAYITVLVNMMLSIGIVVAVGALFFFVLCVVYPSVGFYASYVVCLFLMLPGWYFRSAAMIPTGLIPEYLAYLALLGIVSQQSYRKEITREFWQYPITICFIILIGYTLLEFFNPSMNQKLGWFMYFRKQISFVSFFYASYLFFNSRKSVVFFTKFWIVLSTIEALYACRQQWFGFSSVEYEWLISDPKRYALFVNGAFVRRFGLLSDPSAAGILYASSTVLMLVLALRAKSTPRRVLYWVLTAVHFLACSYTGTRTGTLMIVAGVAFYCILTLYEKKTLIFSGIMLFAFLTLMFAPIYNNIIINRLRSTFEGSKDPSAKVRDLNRQGVQPYVLSHPIGGGIATVGAVGEMYNPGHYLNTVPPDSAYMYIMMEQGPIGLALTLIFYYLILRAGIKYLYRVRDPEVQTMYIGHLVPLFTILVGQFSQMGAGYPSGLYFYSVIAMLLKLYKYDSDKPLEYQLI